MLSAGGMRESLSSLFQRQIRSRIGIGTDVLTGKIFGAGVPKIVTVGIAFHFLPQNNCFEGTVLQNSADSIGRNRIHIHGYSQIILPRTRDLLGNLRQKPRLRYGDCERPLKFTRTLLPVGGKRKLSLRPGSGERAENPISVRK